MANYEAYLMHGERGGTGVYRFEGPDDLLELTPVKTLRFFMEWLETANETRIGHFDYAINAAMKNKEKGIVTGLGEFLFNDGEQPFVCMINAEGAG